MKLYNYFIVLIFCKFHIISSTRVSEKKCEEYSKLFQSKENRNKREIPADNFFANFFDFPPPGKTPTEPGEFPHMARLGFNDVNDKQIFLCGGVLISDQYILTSATCTTTNIVFVHARRRRETMSSNEPLEDISLPPHAPLKWIHLGNNIKGIQEFTPEQIILHPEYKNESSVHYNIALLKLSKKVHFTEHIRPACLYSNEDLTNKTVIGTGWGRTSFNSRFSQNLMKVELEVFSEIECKKFYETNIAFNENEICVGHRSGSNTLCEGDGGAPLQVKNKKYKGLYDIIGIVSMFYTCNIYDFPIHAAKIMAFIPWIENIVWTK